MQRTHCDLCLEEIRDNLYPRTMIRIVSSEGKKEARLTIMLQVEEIISNKDLGIGYGGNNYIPSLPEMSKIAEGYDICQKCWEKILEAAKLKMEISSNIPLKA